MTSHSMDTKGADHVTEDHVETAIKELSGGGLVAGFTPAEQKRIIRRIDLRLAVTLGCLYCISLLDRTNLGAASVAGMQTSLHMNKENNAYTIVSLMFFISYTIFQAPAVVFIRKLGPRNFLAGIVLAWGAVMIGFGFVPSWEVMCVLRVILGALEAGQVFPFLKSLVFFFPQKWCGLTEIHRFYPGCVYLLSTWYPRFDLQKRNATFYLIGSMASGFGGILAYGLMQMDGLSGLSGWRWIFIMEGILTCVLAVGAWFIIVDFPEDSPKSWRFLNEAEATFVVARIEKDRSDTFPDQFFVGKYLRNALDSKVWAFAWLYMLTTTNSYAIAYFLPIILRDGMGFSIAAAQCLTAPPYVCAAIVMFIEGWFADKWRVRGVVVVFNALMGILGLGLLGYVKTDGVRYFGVFLATTACNANCPALITYQGNNVRGQWKRALTSATLVGGGSIGGIIGTTVFRAKDAPNYRPGILACLIANGLIVLIVAGLSFKFHRANKRVDNGGKPIEGLQGFKYTL